QKICRELMDEENPAEFNQAIMEFGALQCTPKQAKCNSCPFQAKCFAYSNQMVDQLPVKKNKTKQRNRYFQYLIIQSKNELLIKQRKSKGIWQNLFDFPLIEFEKEIDTENLLKSEHFQSLLNGKNFKVEATSKSYKHILSHQIIYANFHHLKVANFDGLDLSKFVQVKNSDLEEYPIPKLIENYLKEETNLLSLLDT
ncbi:MAG: NUDIX domain-containing protein, partial [Vicingaceae bacterium]